LGRAASRAFGALASGYPLHHLRALRALRWFRCYPSRNERPMLSQKKRIDYKLILYAFFYLTFCLINANNGFKFIYYFVVFLSFLSPKIGFYCRDRACPVSTWGKICNENEFYVSSVETQCIASLHQAQQNRKKVSK
jgi:hypothetical protein